MRRIVISGYYGLGNVGDEAVLAGMLSSLRILDEGIEPVVLSGDPSATTAAHGVSSVDRYSPAAVVKSLREADLLISGGGSLLQDVTSLRSALYYFGIILAAQALRTPVIVYAQGIGPLTRRSTRLLARVLLNRAKLITVRDAESAALLKLLGVTRPPIELTADPSFALDAIDDDEATRALAEAGMEPGRPLLGVSLRRWKVAPGWSEAVAEGIARAAADAGAVPVFLPMQQAGDVGLSEEIAAAAGGGAIVFRQPPAPRLAKAIVGKMRALIGMRLHALMFAAAMGVPAVALSYDPKVAAFAGEMAGAMPVLDATAPDPTRIADAIGWTLANRSSVERTLAARLPQWRREAVRNARLALSLLGSTGTMAAADESELSDVTQ